MIILKMVKTVIQKVILAIHYSLFSGCDMCHANLNLLFSGTKITSDESGPALSRNGKIVIDRRLT